MINVSGHMTNISGHMINAGCHMINGNGCMIHVSGHMTNARGHMTNGSDHVITSIIGILLQQSLNYETSGSGSDIRLVPVKCPYFLGDSRILDARI